MLQDESRIALAVGGSPSLWDIALQDWLERSHATMPEASLTAEALTEETIVRRLLEATLDLGFFFEPPQLAELMVRPVFRFAVIMVADRPGLSAADAIASRYVMSDWGTSFAIAHARHFPDMPPPDLRVGLGRMARGVLLSCGGAGYLARPMVDADLEAGRLHRVDDAPEIERTAYAAFPGDSEKQPILDRLLAQLARGT